MFDLCRNFMMHDRLLILAHNINSEFEMITALQFVRV